ncbi:MAG TPA: T9SS type A sorting domain-containing protein, partial [Chitinophagaceae bacterium]
TMKTITIHTINLQQSLRYCLVSLVVVLLWQAPASASYQPLKGTDTILINKSQTSKKYKIRIYPSATNEVLFFTASGEAGKVYQLYVFDMDGKLVKQTQIHNKETTLLANFVKGNYMFDVFSDDEKIENGTMVVR